MHVKMDIFETYAEFSFCEILDLRKHQRAGFLGTSESFLKQKGQTPHAVPTAVCPFASNGLSTKSATSAWRLLCSLLLMTSQGFSSLYKTLQGVYPIPCMKYWSEEGFLDTLSLNQLLCPKINKIHIEVTAGGQSWLLPESLVSLVAHVLGSMHICPFITAFIDFYLFIFQNLCFLRNRNCTVQSLTWVISVLAINISLSFCSLITELPKALS